MLLQINQTIISLQMIRFENCGNRLPASPAIRDCVLPFGNSLHIEIEMRHTTVGGTRMGRHYWCVHTLLPPDNDNTTINVLLRNNYKLTNSFYTFQYTSAHRKYLLNLRVSNYILLIFNFDNFIIFIFPHDYLFLLYLLIINHICYFIQEYIWLFIIKMSFEDTLRSVHREELIECDKHFRLDKVVPVLFYFI